MNYQITKGFDAAAAVIKKRRIKMILVNGKKIGDLAIGALIVAFAQHLNDLPPRLWASSTRRFKAKINGVDSEFVAHPSRIVSRRLYFQTPIKGQKDKFHNWFLDNQQMYDLVTGGADPSKAAKGLEFTTYESQAAYKKTLAPEPPKEEAKAAGAAKK